MILENDSESPSALKSNMAAGEIRFFDEKNYLGDAHPSTKKISRLNLQILIRMILDLQKGNSFTLVGSNLKSYSSGLRKSTSKILYDARKCDSRSRKRSRSTGAERERLEALDRRVSSERV